MESRFDHENIFSLDFLIIVQFLWLLFNEERNLLNERFLIEIDIKKFGEEIKPH